MFIDRDESGKIVGQYAIQQHDGQEYLPDSSLELNPPSSLHKFRNGAWELDNSKLVDSLKAELRELEIKELIPRGVRETDILAIPLLTLLMSTLTTQQKAAMETIKAQLYAGNPHYKNLVDTDAIATEKRKEIRDLS